MAGRMYEIRKSQRIPLNKGMLLLFPGFAFLWCLGCFANIGMPPTLNFLGEVLLVCRGVGVSSWFAFFLGLMCFLAGAYCLYLYTTVCHGGCSFMVFPFRRIRSRYMLSGLYLIYPLFLGFLGLDFFMV